MVHESFLVSRAMMTCLDQDPHALAVAEQGLRDAESTYGRCLDARFVQQAVRDIIQGGMADLPQQDFIYSLGLYDYLPTAPAHQLTQILAHQLRPGGRLIIGNYLIGHDIQPALELIMDWFLIERSPEDIAALAADLGPGFQAEVQPDSTGSIGFLIVNRSAATTA